MSPEPKSRWIGVIGAICGSIRLFPPRRATGTGTPAGPAFVARDEAPLGLGIPGGDPEFRSWRMPASILSILFILMGTCGRLGVEPYPYPCYLVPRLGRHPQKDNWELTIQSVVTTLA